ncbi:insulinase family protein [Lactiplantibacillus plantarum]|uniref:insulinase family protein n=1 Tax=Lactiplantibacillus plantarum TaxID=1590 RepID=UPI003C6D9078
MILLEQITLNNNLPIFHLKSSNLGEQVNITVWFRVGSRNDKEGKFGAAHLIEHSMLRILINKNIDLKEYLLKNALEYKILTSIDFILLRFYLY